MPSPLRLDSPKGADADRPSLIAPCLLLALLTGCAGLALVMMYGGAWFLG